MDVSRTGSAGGPRRPAGARPPTLEAAAAAVPPRLGEPPAWAVPRHARLPQHRVPMGRLSLTVHAVVGLPDGGRPDRRVAACVRFELVCAPGGGGGALRAATHVVRGQPISDIAFGERDGAGGDGAAGRGAGDTVVLTLTDRIALPQRNSSSAAPLPLLRYSVVAPGMLGEDTLAGGCCSVGSLFAPAAAGTFVLVSLPLVPAHRMVGRRGAVAPAATPAGPGPAVHVTAMFQALCPGALVLALHAGVGLANRDGAGARQDPYVLAAAGAGGRVKARSTVLAHAGTEVDWAGEALTLWMAPDTWAAPLDISVWDADVLTADDLVGRAVLDPVAWMAAAAGGGAGGGAGGDGERPGSRGGAASGGAPSRGSAQAERPASRGTSRRGSRGDGDTDAAGATPAGRAALPARLPRAASAGGQRRPLPHPRRAALPLTAHGAPAGTLTLSHAFYPVGELTVRVCEGRRLPPHAAALGGEAGRYVELALLSSVAPVRVRTRASPGGGAFPSWGDAFTFDVVDAAELRVRVRDADAALQALAGGSGDDCVGEVVVDLGSAFRYGARDAWVPLKRTSAWGERSTAGEVRLAVTFSAPRGYAYPMLHPGVPAFDDAERAPDAVLDWAAVDPVSPAELEAAAAGGGGSGSGALAAGDAAATVAADARASRTSAASAAGADAPLTEDEASAAFAFCDLDRNGALGASELRHLLVCMGELATDEEVDEMIAMLDADGDGQVSFAEFKRLVTAGEGGEAVSGMDVAGGTRPMTGAAPPSVPGPPPIAVRDAHGRTVAVLPGDAHPAVRRAALHRTAAAAAAARKRAACEAWVAARALRLPDLREALERHRRAVAQRAGGGGGGDGDARVSLPELCAAFSAERDDRTLCTLYDVFAGAGVGASGAGAAAGGGGGGSTSSRGGGGGGGGGGDGDGRPVGGGSGASTATRGTAAVGSAAAAADGRVDIREVILALSGFVGAPRAQRASLVFEVYDTDDSGSITVDELVAVLRASHLAGSAAEVARKAQTLLDAVDADASGAIELAEFQTCAERFGGLLFPSWAPGAGAASDDGGTDRGAGDAATPRSARTTARVAALVGM